MARQVSYTQILARQQGEARQRQATEARARREAERESANRYVGARTAEVDWRNSGLEQQISRLTNILAESLRKPNFDLISLELSLPTTLFPDSIVPSIPPVEPIFLTIPFVEPIFPIIPPVEPIIPYILPVEPIFPPIPSFNPGNLDIPEPPPSPEAYRVPSLSTKQKLLPGAKKKFEQDIAEIAARYKADIAAHKAREESRKRALIDAKAKYEQRVAEARRQAMLEAKVQHEKLVAEARHWATLDAKSKHEQLVAKARQQAWEEAEANHRQRVAEARNQAILEAQQKVMLQHAEIETLKHDYTIGTPDAVTAYCSLVLDTSDYPDDFPRFTKVAYVPESKHLVVEYDLPLLDIVPEVAAYKFVKSKDEITNTARPATQRKALYASVIAQIALRVLYELFNADFPGHIDTIVFNGYVDTIDQSTGHPIRPCLVTVRTTRDVFMALNLSKVDPAACLKGLSASVSKSPSELEPVKPVIEFNMVDPRFVQESDVLSALDQRANLMELTPLEFESLITNLFQKMGLETRQTQASRDGGVDCVAYNTNPILGGKVVIQAKRYKHTVGVSAVRDLYGTLLNEGASKGILITTSGYGKASYEFAAGKPLELFSGSNLLHMLAEYAGIEAKIEPPEDWKDPQMDAASEEA